MTRADWDYVHLPKSMIDKLKKISKEEGYQTNGLNSPSKIIEQLVRKHFEENDI